MSAIIYRLTNTVNQKTYIGLTTKTLEHRWRMHVNSARNGSSTHLHRSIRKHGRGVFVCEVLENTTLDMMNERERHWIHTLQPFYNMTNGGEGSVGYTHSPEVRAHLRQRRAERGPISEETRLRMSESRRGKKMSEECRRKHSERQRGQSRPSPSEETRRKRSIAMKKTIEEKKRLGTYEHKGGRRKTI